MKAHATRILMCEEEKMFSWYQIPAPYDSVICVAPHEHYLEMPVSCLVCEEELDTNLSLRSTQSVSRVSDWKHIISMEKLRY